MWAGNRLLVHTYSHFCVDFASVFLVFFYFTPRAENAQSVLLGIVTYNCLAFALQPIMGALTDRFSKLHGDALGILLVLVGFLLHSVPWAALCIAALGNALFHVGAGREVLLRAGGKLSPGGVFVSSGALGVPLGVLAAGGGLSPFLPGILLLAALCLCLAVRERRGLPGACRFMAASGLSFGVVLILALVSVGVRAFVGSAVPMGWKTGSLILLPGIAAFLGKACGGFLADALGPCRTGVGALVLSIPLLCLGSEQIVLCTLGVLVFHITMPVSLGTVAAKLPENPGLAFGLTAQLLLVGILPLMLWKLPSGFTVPLCIGLTIVSALCMFFSAGNSDKNLPHRKPLGKESPQ